MAGLFDDVRFKVAMNKVSYEVDSEEGPYVTDRKYPDGNMGHRPGVKGGYIYVRDAVKHPLPKDAPKPGAFRLKGDGAAKAEAPAAEVQENA